MICPCCEGAGGVKQEFVDVAIGLDSFIEIKMGGPPDKCNVGKSVDLRITVDVLELCDLVGGRWKAWANAVRDSRAEIQLGYNKRDSVKEHT
jgi:hypothetical protein